MNLTKWWCHSDCLELRFKKWSSAKFRKKAIKENTKNRKRGGEKFEKTIEMQPPCTPEHFTTQPYKSRGREEDASKTNRLPCSITTYR